MKITRRNVIAGAVVLIPTSVFAGKADYRYDARGRLIAALYPDAALSVYEYDSAGNRTVAKNPYVGPTITTDCFDAQYYLRAYPDIAAAGVDPYSHYMSYGRYEARNPNSFFSTSGYLAAYPDIASAGVNPLTHYCNNGWVERRDPSLQFDTKLYLDGNQDVKDANMNPLLHYLRNGYGEGRSPQGDGAFRPT